MQREILTYPLEPAQIKQELQFLAEQLHNFGCSECDILLGFEWGMAYYGTNPATYERIATDALVAKIVAAEETGLGRLGQDDLYVRIIEHEIEFRFCNDCDIHLTFEPPSVLAESFYQRWKSQGFSPAEWVKVPGAAATERIRFN
jgi:hypothetical protein